MCEQLIEIKQVSNKKRLSYQVSVYYVIYTFNINRKYYGIYGGMNVVRYIFIDRSTCFTGFNTHYRKDITILTRSYGYSHDKEPGFRDSTGYPVGIVIQGVFSRSLRSQVECVRECSEVKDEKENLYSALLCSIKCHHCKQRVKFRQIS